MISCRRRRATRKTATMRKPLQNDYDDAGMLRPRRFRCGLSDYRRRFHYSLPQNQQHGSSYFCYRSGCDRNSCLFWNLEELQTKEKPWCKELCGSETCKHQRPQGCADRPSCIDATKSRRMMETTAEAFLAAEVAAEAPFTLRRAETVTAAEALASENRFEKIPCVLCRNMIRSFL